MGVVVPFWRKTLFESWATKGVVVRGKTKDSEVIV